MPEKIVLILSGGMDSTTLLYKLLNDGFRVYPLTFDYGQRHKKEILAATNTINYIKTLKIGNKLEEHKIIDISPISELIKGSALTSKDIDVPHGHYEEPNMKLTVVPNRNMIFLSLAIGYAINIGAFAVSFAAHSGDHAIYPDCRPVFVDAMREAAKVADYSQVEIYTPFIDMHKTEILQIGFSLNPKVNYALTWTCYEGKEKSCGQCGSCVERLEAFSNIGQTDPLEYLA